MPGLRAEPWDSVLAEPLIYRSLVQNPNNPFGFKELGKKTRDE